MTPIDIDIIHDMSDRLYNLTIKELKHVNEMFDKTVKEFQYTVKNMMATFTTAIKQLSNKLDKLNKNR